MLEKIISSCNKFKNIEDLMRLGQLIKQILFLLRIWKNKKVKQNWTRPENFDIYSCVIFDH